MSFIYLSKSQMSKVDELAVRKYNIQVKQMMENAGKNIARWIVDELKPKKVVCLYGKGNNGGDALCCARHLNIYGVDIVIVPAFEGEPENKELKNHITILDRILVKPSSVENLNLEEGDVIVDGLLGYNISGSPEEKYAELINWANEQRDKGVKIVSVDIPSGMNPDSGDKFNPYVRAHYTIALGMLKQGMKNFSTGKLFLGNVGIPNQLYKKEFNMNVPSYFKEKDVVEVV